MSKPYYYIPNVVYVSNKNLQYTRQSPVNRNNHHNKKVFFFIHKQSVIQISQNSEIFKGCFSAAHGSFIPDYRVKLFNNSINRINKSFKYPLLPIKCTIKIVSMAYK